MIYNLYKYVGSYGIALVYDTDDVPNKHYRDNKDYEFIGQFDLPPIFVKKCLPVSYIE